jgi:RNA polymerase sigma-70 factor (ECF subfamily)
MKSVSPPEGRAVDETANLKNIVTRWSQVFIAKQSAGDTAAEARNNLLVRYHEAVYRYLRLELRDDHAADQIFSNFAVRVLEADRFLKAADPARGRFRDYLKAVLYRMVIDHHRERGRPRPDGLRGDEAGGDGPPSLQSEQLFLESWKQEIVNQAWRALSDVEAQTGRPYATVVRLQEEQEGIRSAQLAEQLSERLGQPFTADGVRKLIQRGRELFGDLLVQEAARSLRGPGEAKVDAERVEQELIKLGLLFSYCKAALARYAAKA